MVIVAALFTTGSISSNRTEKGVYVTVAAGKFDRREVVTSFALPKELKGSRYSLRDRKGHQLEVQIDPDRRATFVLPELKAGATERFQLVESKQSTRAPQSVLVKQNENRLDLTLAGHPVFSFVTKPARLPSPDIKPVFLRGGYIHPILSPSGRLVSDDYPSDHYHHHGIWFAWTKTQFDGSHPDFWNVDDLTGRVDFDSVETSWSGDVHAGFKSKQRYVALNGAVERTALNEEWDVRLYNVGGGSRYFVFDIVATQECATSSPLILEEYRYGGMGVRGHRDWKDKQKVSFLTSEGKTRADGNATRARWCRMYGPVEGRVVGMAILDHPVNFRAPTPMRINPDDPFFNYAPSQLGRFEIKPGERFVLRYRYVVADGESDPADLNRLWNDYADPPQVTVESS